MGRIGPKIGMHRGVWGINAANINFPRVPARRYASGNGKSVRSETSADTAVILRWRAVRHVFVQTAAVLIIREFENLQRPSATRFDFFELLTQSSTQVSTQVRLKFDYYVHARKIKNKLRHLAEDGYKLTK